VFLGQSGEEFRQNWNIIPVLRIFGECNVRNSPDFEVFCLGVEIAIHTSKTKQLIVMILQFFFRQLSSEQQANYLQKNGVSLGSRVKNGRRIYVYMLRNLFVEVMYQDDNANNSPERVNMLRGLKNLNAYLEKEFRASF